MSYRTRFITTITRSSSSYINVSRGISSNTSVPRHHGPTQSFAYRYLSNSNTHTRNFSVHNNVQPGAPLPSQPPSSFSSWILGIVLTVILPFGGSKVGPLLQFKNEVDTAVETIEEIVEVVEEVAEFVDKVAEGIAAGLPEGGEAKKVVDVLEDVAEKTAKDAHAVEDVIDKFQEVEEKVENIVKSLTSDEGNKHSKRRMGNNK